MMEFRSLKGHLLVAEPTMGDPNFARSVVLIIEHTPEGAAGVILNKPSEMAVGEVLPDWEALTAEPGVIFFGGPVSPDAAVGLARTFPAAAPDGFQPVIGGLGVIDLSRPVDELTAVVDRVRIFSGYAGWTEGQLEMELEHGAWFVVDADPGDALSAAPGEQWRFVLRRQGGMLAMVSSFPPEPSMN